ncbi:MAG: Crp/Fnr family transcriptional regulator [Marinibacterium sp.]
MSDLKAPHTETSWIDQFRGLRSLPEDLREELVAGSRVVHVPAGAQVFSPGQPVENLLLLLDGTVRVRRLSDSGREMFLYRVNAGESCVLSTACMLAFEDHSADGIAETDVAAVTIPRDTFDDLTARSREFREFVFKAYSRRITDLFSLIDDIVFQRMDVRLAARLLELADGTNMVRATHQVLGSELGTAREVISRTLAEFQRRGWIEQERGRLRLVQKQSLERLTRSAADF